MKQVIAACVVVFTLYILQSLPAYRLTDLPIPLNWIRAQADLTCIFCTYLGMRENSIVRGTLLALIIGLVANNFSPTSLRLHTLLAPLCFLLTYTINIRFYFKKLEAYVPLLFFMTLLYNFVFFHLMKRVSLWSVGFFDMFGPLILQALINAIFGTIIFLFLDWIRKPPANAYQGTIRY